MKCSEQESELRRCRKTCKTQEISIRKLEEVQDRLEQLRTDTERKHVSCLTLSVVGGGGGGWG